MKFYGKSMVKLTMGSLLFISSLLFFLPTIVLARSHGTCEMTKVFEHIDGLLGVKYVFLFKGNPICSYDQPVIDQSLIDSEVPITLNFFVPCINMSDKSKQAVHEINNKKCHKDYCIRVRSVETPVKGLRYELTFIPKKRGLEFQTFTSITGEQGIMFVFSDNQALNKVNTVTAENKIRRVASLEKPTIILDFGHGGQDTGFMRGDLKEKDINLAIGLEVEKLLKKKGFKVCLTREGDEHLTLDQRTTLAQQCKNAHALISIHTNAAANSNASGIETFCHKDGMFTTQLQINQTYQKIGDQNISAQSQQLAQIIHKNVLEHARKDNPAIVDRKVKDDGVLQISLGYSQAPSVLLELGFLTHEVESKLLQKASYQRRLAQGIYKGVAEFFNVM
ncbi:N-acetylmuramoyl-L-alanine amidase [bacterium]|nr:N-acetylmuramoyl-L-alanine amidase [bacterium]